MTDAQALVACVTERRGRFLSSERVFDDAPPIGLGPLASSPARPGELVLVEPRPDGTVGHVVEVLGAPNDIDVLLTAYAAELGVRRPFPDAVVAAAAGAGVDPPEPHGSREDRRGDIVITIDPADARDHDDAIALVDRPGGLVLVVHIADVADVVTEGGYVDAEARRRGFSTYLPGRVDPMLPAAISAGRCSLLAGRARDVLTVEWPVTDDLTLGPVRLCRSQIAVTRRFTYDEVERVLDGAADPLANRLVQLDAITERLHSARLARGAMEIGGGEARITIGGGRVEDVRLERAGRAHRIVEECMLRANVAVAGFLAQAGVVVPFRVHAAPDHEAVEALYARLAELDVATPPLPETLGPTLARRAVADAARAVTAHVTARAIGGEGLRSVLMRSVTLAHYAATNHGHAGLAEPAYCHFTSPIRRYPDLLVHRALGDLLDARHRSSPDDLAETCAELSAIERFLANAERDGRAIALAHAVADRRGQEVEGEIVGLVGGGLFIRFDDVFEGFLPSRRLGQGRLEVSPLGTALHARNGRRFRLGERLSVRIDRVDVPRRRVDLGPGGDERADPPRPVRSRYYGV